MKSLNFTKQMKHFNKIYKNKDTFIGKDILTIANKINSSRSIMFNSHLDQFVNLLKPDFPRVFTGYEDRVGSVSSAIRESKQEFDIIKKITKFKNQYLLVIKYKDGMYDIIHRKDAEHLTESYCYLNNNEVLDSLEEKQKFQGIYCKSNSYDDFNNYRYGKNLKSCYLIDNDTIEDAIVISESASKKLSSFSVSVVEVSVNTNDVILNLYGDDKNIKIFPNIGEKTREKILLARRRINNNFSLINLHDDEMKKINNNDTIFYNEGTIIDINVYCNKQIEENPYNKQIIHYLNIQAKFYKEIYDTLAPIIEKGKYSEELSYWFLEACNYKKHEEGELNFEEFDNMVIEFHVLHESPIKVGDKLTGRYGCLIIFIEYI